MGPKVGPDALCIRWYLCVLGVFCWYFLIFVGICCMVFVNSCWYLLIFLVICWYIYWYLFVFVYICCYLLVCVGVHWYLLIFVGICLFCRYLLIFVSIFLFVSICCFLLIFVDICWYPKVGPDVPRGILEKCARGVLISVIFMIFMSCYVIFMPYVYHIVSYQWLIYVIFMSYVYCPKREILNQNLFFRRLRDSRSKKQCANKWAAAICSEMVVRFVHWFCLMLIDFNWF